ncbi:DUF3696 domain-containing protein [Brevundimonas sp. S1H14]|uniref:AAA family ATPase n=1 Tax=Brevundimonas sp. S1H14 TaxID=3078084 RepID=UPI0039E77968
MIKEWSVEGFKSVRGPTSLPLGKITVFAGANSGGKSTFLQSMLLLKQTLQYGAPNRPLALNGPIMRLGAMDDVICATADTRSIKIGFRLDVPNVSASSDAPWIGILQRASFRAVEQGHVTSVQCSFDWMQRENSQVRAADKLQAVLTRGELQLDKFTPESDDHHTYFCKYELMSKAMAHDAFSVKLDSISDSQVLDDRPDSEARAVHVSHFLPTWVEVRFNETKQRARNIATSLFSHGRFIGRVGASNNPNDLLPGIALSLVNDWLEENSLPLIYTEPSPTIGDASDHLRKFISRRGTLLSQRSLFASDAPNNLLAVQELQDSIEQALVDAEPRQEFSSDIEMPRNVSQGAEFIKSYFKLGIRYLGPLRDEPRPVYPLEIVENPTDVGYRGEHTAAVLELNANKWVQYLPSSYYSDGKTKNATRYGKLIDAVRDWLGYLGVAEDVVAHEQGVFGNRLQVTTSGLGKWHDLTNVGVGVSQVLPIVVSALLAPSTSVLIFEQPELHLHPRVQARLADFFLSLASAGRQCVVETHSEYMIERLRLRIAEDDGNLQDDLKVYFAERSNGETRYRDVPISRYGAVIDWPEDFFDQSQFETSRILEAAARKRANDRAENAKKDHP